MAITDKGIDLLVSWCAEHLVEDVFTRGTYTAVRHHRINGLVFCSTGDEIHEEISYPVIYCDVCQHIYKTVKKRLELKTKRDRDREAHLAIKDIWMK